MEEESTDPGGNMAAAPPLMNPDLADLSGLQRVFAATHAAAN